MRHFAPFAVAALLAGLSAFTRVYAEDKPGEWVTILDAKSFKDWKVAPDKAGIAVTEEEGAKKYTGGQWSFKDGVLKGEGNVSHIFSPRNDYEDFHFKAEIKISDKGNSGQYFRVQYGNGWPKGYEAQINSSHTDPKRTGSLYGIKNITEQLVPPDTWFTQEVIAIGNKITIKVNDKAVVEHEDDQKRYSKGHVAFQQHNLGSEVQIKNVQIKEIKK